MFSRLVTILMLVTSFATFANAELTAQAEASAPNLMDELDPFDPNIEAKLLEMDRVYMEETGKSPFVEELIDWAPGCSRSTCPVFIDINKTYQTANLYQNGRVIAQWLVSTGGRGHATPDFEGRPNGRIYDRYTSTKYPEGDYNGLGNMPYAVFYKGGFAIHGTTPGSFKHLGKRASHGCVRLHPDNGYIFNRLVRQNGIKNVWISIHD